MCVGESLRLKNKTDRKEKNLLEDTLHGAIITFLKPIFFVTPGGVILKIFRVSRSKRRVLAHRVVPHSCGVRLSSYTPAGTVCWHPYQPFAIHWLLVMSNRGQGRRGSGELDWDKVVVCSKASSGQGGR